MDATASPSSPRPSARIAQTTRPLPPFASNLPTELASPRELGSYLYGRTALAESRVNAGGKTYRLVHPASAEALIDETDFERDERLPYWAEVWPSAVALACHLSTLYLGGRRVVELGCGVGLPAAVALERGARVLATDHYEAALEFTRHNCRINMGREPETAHLDWHSPVEESVERNGFGGRFDLVIAADVLYESRHAPALARLIQALLAPNGEIFISDPRRKDTPVFLEQMGARGFRCSERRVVVRQSKTDIEVLIHCLRRATE